MALAANLEVEFGQDGFNLTATVDGLGEDLGAISIPEVDLDAGEIADAATRLGEVDAGALGGAVDSLLDVIGAVRGGIPVLSDLVAPLTVAIEAGQQLSTGFDSFSIGDLLGAGADIEGVGLGS